MPKYLFVSIVQLHSFQFHIKGTFTVNIIVRRKFK